MVAHSLTSVQFLAGPSQLAPRHYMVQPLVELYGGCMAVLKVS